VNASPAARPRSISVGAWLTPRRIAAQAIVLAICLWGVCAVDFAAPGLFDRAGNIKFQDFLPLYVSARLISQNRSSQLYDQPVVQAEAQEIVRQPTRARIPNLYGPQVGLLFVPLVRFSFQTAAWIWVALCTLLYFGCTFLVWKCCPALQSHAALVAVCALAFPPLFHFFVRGQTSVLPLLCFTAAYLAFRARRDWLAGIFLGCLVLKPQFLVAIPFVLLLSRSWRALDGFIVSAFAQLLLARIYFGLDVIRTYLDMLLHASRWIGDAELSLAPIQMHSLRSFWLWLIPWPNAALALYALTACITIALAAAIWRSPRPLALRFSALTLAAVLVNPHLFVYDLLALAPVIILLADEIISCLDSRGAFRLLLYLTFVTPLLGPLSQWTHFQFSVPVFAALLWTISRTPGHTSADYELASSESRIV
jgi:hypothetical protein